MARSITVIPAKETKVDAKGKTTNKQIRVAAYCRVSTDNEDQLHSFETQVTYYTDYINSKPEYEMAGIYADEGLSGTSTKKREQFKQMITDCEDGKIDLVITKSISRFARNTHDCLTYSRKLQKLGIAIIFEKENINTLETSGELLFTILSSLAQDESRNISENCKWGIRSKFKKGEMQITASTFLGYDKDEDGKLIINKEQAVIVKRIFEEFLYGKNPTQIASDLQAEGIKNGRGNTKWYPSTVVGILCNEKHKGDALLQKYYTADFLSKRLVKNHGEVTQYYVTDSHEGIIDRDTWDAANEELKRREEYRKKHGIANYSYGFEWNPFTGRVFCGKCGAPYMRHCWRERGITQWQCKNHRKNGVLECTNRHLDEEKLTSAFVKAFNSLYGNKEAFLKKKEAALAKGTPLERLRARQMIDLLQQPPLECFVPELAQMVIEEVTVVNETELIFTFLDGTVKKVRI